MNAARLHRRVGGFTLLELLVALAVFAVLAAAAYGGLRSVIMTRAAVETEARRLAQVQMAFHFLEQDIQQASRRSIRDEFGQPQPALQGSGANDPLFTLTRAGWDNPLGRPRSTLQRLAYRLADGRLWRLYWTTLDRAGVAEPLITSLLDDVREARVRFLDDQDAWQTAWPPTAREGEVIFPPRAIEITLVLEDWGDITRLFLVPGA